jgi:hypothetical protein
MLNRIYSNNKVPNKGDKSNLAVIHNLAGSEEMTKKKTKE